MAHAIKKNIQQRCPKCGNALLNNYGELYCLCCGSSPSSLKATDVTIKDSKMVCKNCVSKTKVKFGKYKGV